MVVAYNFSFLSILSLDISCLIFSIIALPTMTASAPASIICFTCNEVLIPNPTATFAVGPAMVFMFLIEVIDYFANELLTPVVPKPETTYTKPEECLMIFFILSRVVFGDTRNTVAKPSSFANFT